MSGMGTVRILEWRFGYIPRRFQWRGRAFDVLRVVQIQGIRREWPRRIRQRVYRLETRHGTFELRHDVIRDIWRAGKVPAGCQREGEVRTRVARARSKSGRLAHGNRYALVR